MVIEEQQCFEKLIYEEMLQKIQKMIIYNRFQ